MLELANDDDGAGGKLKCGLLAILPKPKSSFSTVTTSAAAEDTRQQKARALPAELPASLLEIHPRQTPKTTMHVSTKPIEDFDDDDDEEFDAKLITKLIHHQFDDEKDNEEEVSDPEEGPTLPPLVMDVANGQISEKRADKMGVEKIPQITVNRSLGIDYGDSSSSGDDEQSVDDKMMISRDQDSCPPQVDFFGLSSHIDSPSSVKRAKLAENYELQHPSIEFSSEDPIISSKSPCIFIDQVAPGPSRPIEIGSPVQREGEEIQQRKHKVRAITDQEAHNLIYEKELAPFGASAMIANDAVNMMIDVSVDSALGPNVRENLLKNLSGKQMAKISLGPLPKVKKSDSDKLAKRKHQITHLAAVAVSREEQLQEKWAESKNNKKMSRQKYGF